MSFDWKELVALALPVILFVAGQYRVLSTPGDPAERQHADNDSDVPREGFGAVCAVTAVLAVSFGLSWGTLLLLGRYDGFSVAVDEISILPTPMVWALPGALLGFALFGVAGAFLSEKAPWMFSFETHSDFERSQARSLLWTIAGTCALAFMLTWRVQNFYAVFSGDGMQFGRPTDLHEIRYSYEDVRSVSTGVIRVGFSARSQRFRPGLVIGFSDGRTWTWNHSPVDLSKGQIRQIAEFVAERANLEIDAGRIFTRNDAW